MASREKREKGRRRCDIVTEERVAEVRVMQLYAEGLRTTFFSGTSGGSVALLNILIAPQISDSGFQNCGIS
jgi:hypothetical protein